MESGSPGMLGGTAPKRSAPTRAAHTAVARINSVSRATPAAREEPRAALSPRQSGSSVLDDGDSVERGDGDGFS